MGTTYRVETIDPRDLLVDKNVREAHIDSDFTASIREYGVLQPIVAVPADDGRIRVRHGHRRTLAAVEAGRDTVPVVITDDDGADEAARILTQWAENEHRAALTSSEKIAAVGQLAAFGMSPSQIARRAKTPIAQVAAALTAHRSELARKATERYAFLSLDQAAAVAECDDDAEAVKALVAAAKDGRFPHVAQRLRDERDERDQRFAVATELVGAGVRLIGRPSDEGYPQAARRLSQLTRDGQAITPEDHASCPGHAAYVETTWAYEADPEDAEDPDGEGEVGADADETEDDERDGDGHRPVRRAAAVYVCTDPAGNGHADNWSLGAAGGRPAGPLTEKQKADRRRIIDTNKAWRSAETVRREWLATFLARRTPPKGTAAYLARRVAGGDHALRRSMENGHRLAHILLGVEDTRPEGYAYQPSATLLRLVEDAGESRAQVIHLALTLAASEAATGTHSWRNPTQDTAGYLSFLAGHGYPLAQVEQDLIDATAQRDAAYAAVAAGDDEATQDGQAAEHEVGGQDTGDVDTEGAPTG